jgi:hypothetical protein
MSIAGTPSLTETEGEASNAGNPVTHVVYVAAMNDPGGSGTSAQTDSQMMAEVRDVTAYWTAQANGAVVFEVRPTVEHFTNGIDPASTSCGLGSGIQDYLDTVWQGAALFPDYVPFSGTDHLVVFVPPSCSSGQVEGVGNIGASFATGGAVLIRAGDETRSEDTLAHEMGHNFGLQHAYAVRDGHGYEYFGLYDVMCADGPNARTMSALSTTYRVFEGIVDPGEIHDVDLGDATSPVQESVTLQPRSSASGVRSIRVVEPGTGQVLYLDYRSGTGQDAGSLYNAGTGVGVMAPDGSGPLLYTRGVTINAAHGTGGSDVLVVDEAGDTSLAAGKTWSDPTGKLTVTVTGMTQQSAAVTVDYKPTA